VNEPDLFAYNESYPASPGWKGRSTSRLAAESMKPKAPTIQQRIMGLLHPALALTPDEAAEMLGLPIWTVRPRFSELGKQGKLVDTGRRRRNESGKAAIVWQLA
jgi:predicted ArsR family transcriptional regulator